MAANGPVEHPSTTASAASKKLSTYDLIIGLFAIFSLIILVLIAFVPLSPSTKEVLNNLEVALCAVFLFDFFRSLFRAPHKWTYFLRGGGWLDLLGSIPFSAFAVFRIARLFRIVRVVRTLRGSEFREMLLERLAESTLLFTLLIAVVMIFVIGAIVAWAEHGAPNANIETYPEGVWWAVVTITTVGYGDYFPVTTVGRIAAAVLMFCGLGIIGVLSSYLATTFITLQARRAARRGVNNTASAQEGTGDEAYATGDDTSRQTGAELAASREELKALRALLEERSQTH
jgi:voltage-gated potassium channel